LAALAEELETAGTPVAGIFTESTLTEVQETFAAIDRLADDLEIQIESIDDTLNVLKGVLKTRLERTIYEHQQETYLLRFELSDYYLFEGDYAESPEEVRRNYADAAEQLGYVLDIDPFNTGATYKLGILYDRLGSWSRAMESYAEVYDADPRFGNVAANYNRLARSHADTANVEFQLNADSSRINQKTSLALGNELNSTIGLRTYAASETVRMYRGDPEVAGTVDPWQYQVHDLSIAVPLTIPAIGITLTPLAGIEISSNLIDDNIPPGDSVPIPEEVIGSYDIEPVFGGSFYLATDYLSVSGSYRYGRFDESYQPGTPGLVSHNAEASAKFSFDVFDQEILKYSSIRAGGDLDLLYNLTGSCGWQNTIFGFDEYLEIIFHLIDSPWTNVTVFQSFDYMSSVVPGATEYFAPENRMLVSGGVGISTSLDIGDDSTLGLTFSALFPGSIGEAQTQTYVAADLRAELTIAEVTYYASANATVSAESLLDLENWDYWSTAASLGVTAKLPRLLAE
jgi:tetratricopeptide (TPR) repeat protein